MTRKMYTSGVVLKKTDDNKILLSQDYLKDAIKTKLSIVWRRHTSVSVVGFSTHSLTHEISDNDNDSDNVPDTPPTPGRHETTMTGTMIQIQSVAVS